MIELRISSLIFDSLKVVLPFVYHIKTSKVLARITRTDRLPDI